MHKLFSSWKESLILSFNISARNWTVYKKDLIANISPTVADPALVLVSLGLGLGSFITNVDGMSYMQFLAPGLTVATALFTSFFENQVTVSRMTTVPDIWKLVHTKTLKKTPKNRHPWPAKKKRKPSIQFCNNEVNLFRGPRM